jgi:deoxyribonuclease-4
MILGAHCSTAGGVDRALDRAERIGADACQIFVKNNMQWQARKYTESEVEKFRERRTGSRCGVVFGHTGYLINVAAPASENRQRSIQSLILEIELAAQLGLSFLVLHPGAHLGNGEEEGLRQAARGLDEAIAATRGLSVRIALENTAGQGSCLGHDLRHWQAIYERVRHPERLGVCVDTAHCFAAGYDVRTRAGWSRVMEEVESTVGLDQLLAFHLNDSKTELGSRVDRHAGIGLGRIGGAAFGHMINDPRFIRHPACLETPKSADLHEDIENLAVLRSMLKAKRKAKLRVAGGRKKIDSAPDRRPSARRR